MQCSDGCGLANYDLSAGLMAIERFAIQGRSGVDIRSAVFSNLSDNVQSNKTMLRRFSTSATRIMWP